MDVHCSPTLRAVSIGFAILFARRPGVSHNKGLSSLVVLVASYLFIASHPRPVDHALGLGVFVAEKVGERAC